jgi:hypothetical protein
MMADGWISGALTIPKETNALFRERVCLQHEPRTLSSSFTPDALLPSTYCFFDASSPKEKTIKTPHIIPDRAAGLIDKANQHNCFLGVLGILPNQLRTLFKEYGHSDDIEVALEDISRSLFFAGFEIWNKRQMLGSKYWKDVAPETRNDPIARKGAGKAQQAQDKSARSKCRNPFHYLRKVSTLSTKRPTRCPCAAQPRPTPAGNQDIRAFLLTFPTVAINRILPVKPTDFLTRSDAIRRQQDGKKKRKLSLKKLSRPTKKAK